MYCRCCQIYPIKYKGRGLCKHCYHRLIKKGKLETYPKVKVAKRRLTPILACAPGKD